MPLGTLDRTPPPFFRQGPSALTRLTFFVVLAAFLMVADARYQVVRPLRSAIATALYPLQWLAMRPVVWVQAGSGYFGSLRSAQTQATSAQQKLALLTQRAGQVEQLTIENTRLRELLGLRLRLGTNSQAAQVLYDAADPYTRRVIVDQGHLQGIALGSPVLTDREQAIPVLNTRTGARGLAFGDPNSRGGGLELRFMAANADVQTGDLLSTSGVDGVYPAGLPVARVDKVERRVDSAFARISCQALAQVNGVEHVLVLAPLLPAVPAPVEPTTGPTAVHKGGRR